MNDYYLNCPFPKAGKPRKKKKCNGWKDKVSRYCRYHGTPYAERHEVFGGPNRQFSIDNELQVDVCPECHRQLTDNVTAWAQQENAVLRREFQLKHIDHLMDEGLSEEQALRQWMIDVGRNYVEEMMPE